MDRYALGIVGTPERLGQMRRFLRRYGVAGVVVARFLPGLRCLGGPLAGTTPLLREGEPLGVIAIRRMELRPFSDKQGRLLETFAAQAAIAIKNVPLFKELEARKRDLSEALERETGARVDLCDEYRQLTARESPQVVCSHCGASFPERRFDRHRSGAVFIAIGRSWSAAGGGGERPWPSPSEGVAR